ncbi:hypothetical protein D7I46_08685 [Lactococcus allomyrinae]|uniref:Uncharacterized protein n=1 Tax=Lactococcus allomyrinae TaxID=2419773 RepID=A0A387BJG1_9LACT|nr:hypothetical protein D7I46_08685 [Lactococcus allomyrinae]
MYITCEPKKSHQFPSFEENHWERLFKHHAFECQRIELSPFDFGIPLEQTVIIQTDAPQSEIEVWLSNWASTVEKPFYLVNQLGENYATNNPRLTKSLQ